MSDISTIDPALGNLFALVAQKGFPSQVMVLLGKILCDLATPHSVALVVFSLAAEVLLEMFPSDDGTQGWKAIFEGPVPEKFQRVLDTHQYASTRQWMNQSVFGDHRIAAVLEHYRREDLPKELAHFLRYIARNTMRAFPDEENLRKARPIEDEAVPCRHNEEETHAFRESTSIWPYHPIIRARGRYLPEQGRAGLCTHAFPSQQSHTGG